MIKHLAEKFGIYLFFISFFIFIQLRWMKRHNNYALIEFRLLGAFFAGALISYGLVWLISRIRKDKDAKDRLLKEVSVALSPGILFVFASLSKISLIIGLALCILIGFYIWYSPFRAYVKRIMDMNKFENTLIVNNRDAVIKVSGVYERQNPELLHAFLSELINNFSRCNEQDIKEVKIDFSDLKIRDTSELKLIVESISMYFNLKVIYK